MLILGRSALGRIVLILGLVLGTTVLGYMAMVVPAGGDDQRRQLRVRRC